MIGPAIGILLIILSVVSVRAIRRAQARRTEFVDVSSKTQPDADSTKPESTPKPPAPASAVSARSYSWIWWIIIIVVVALVGRWIWYEWPSVRSAYSPPPRATAPRRDLQKFNLNVDLPTALDKEQSRISVARIVDGTPSVSVGKGGKAFFQLEALPKATLGLFLDYTLVDGKSGYVTVTVNGVEHSNIYFTPEGCGMLFKIPEAMVKEKNTVAIAPNSAMQIKRLWLKETQQ